MKKSTLVITILVLIPWCMVSGFEFITPRGIGMGHTTVMSKPTAAGMVGLPGLGFSPDHWRFDSGFSRRYELPELDQMFLAGAYRWRTISIAVGASQFGDGELYAEQTLKGSVTYHHDSLSVGGSISVMQLQIGGGYGELRAATFGIGASYRAGRFLAAFDADNLSRPSMADNSLSIEPVYSLHTELMGRESYSITGRLTLEEQQKPQFALAQIIRLSPRGSLFWGFATAPLEFGGGIELSIPPGVFSYATSVHPVLGFSHTASLSFGSQSHERSGDVFK